MDHRPVAILKVEHLHGAVVGVEVVDDRGGELPLQIFADGAHHVLADDGGRVPTGGRPRLLDGDYRGRRRRLLAAWRLGAWRLGARPMCLPWRCRLGPGMPARCSGVRRIETLRCDRGWGWRGRRLRHRHLAHRGGDRRWGGLDAWRTGLFHLRKLQAETNLETVDPIEAQVPHLAQEPRGDPLGDEDDSRRRGRAEHGEALHDLVRRVLTPGIGLERPEHHLVIGLEADSDERENLPGIEGNQVDGAAAQRDLLLEQTKPGLDRGDRVGDELLELLDILELERPEFRPHAPSTWSFKTSPASIRV